MTRHEWLILMLLVVPAGSNAGVLGDLGGCGVMVGAGFRAVAAGRDRRFLGKVKDTTARCRGGERAVKYRSTPWVDWANYWATGDASTKKWSLLDFGHFSPNGRGIDGALLDLEYQRIELIKFNLLDNSGTYRDYEASRDGIAGPALKIWPEMRLAPEDIHYRDVGGSGLQLC